MARVTFDEDGIVSDQLLFGQEPLRGTLNLATLRSNLTGYVPDTNVRKFTERKFSGCLCAHAE